MTDLKDDSEEVSRLLDDVEISSMSELEIEQLKKLLPLKGWGFPNWVYSEGAPEGFGLGIYADIGQTSNKEIVSNRFIPLPLHLFPEDKQVDGLIVDTFHKFLSTQGILWADFNQITPTLMLLLTGKPPIQRIHILEYLEKQILEEYDLKKNLYKEAYEAFQTSTDDGRKLAFQFIHPPERFALTDEGRRLINRYLVTTRGSRIKEDVSLSQYKFSYSPPKMSTFEILFRYHRMRDLLEAHSGFLHYATNTRNYNTFIANCTKANLQYNIEIENLLETVLQQFPAVKRNMLSIHRLFEDGYSVPDWNISDTNYVEDLAPAMHKYTILMIAAIERCIMTMIDIPESTIPYLLTTQQPEFYSLFEKDEERFNIIEDVRGYNDLVHVLRTRYLPSWYKISDGNVACFDDRESSQKISQYLQNVILNLARQTYSLQNIHKDYLQLKQSICFSKTQKIPFNPRKNITIFETDTHNSISPFF